jgi:hypothetical protein
MEIVINDLTDDFDGKKKEFENTVNQLFRPLPSLIRNHCEIQILNLLHLNIDDIAVVDDIQQRRGLHLESFFEKREEIIEIINRCDDRNPSKHERSRLYCLYEYYWDLFKWFGKMFKNMNGIIVNEPNSVFRDLLLDLIARFENIGKLPFARN